MSSEKIDIPGLLSRMPLFSALAPDDLAHLAAATRERRLQKGERLFQRGEQPRGFFLIVWGQVKLAFTSAQGVEKIVEVVEQGQSFGEAMMFLDKPYVVSAQALSNSLLLHVSKAAVFGEMERDHGTLRKMLSSLAQRTHQLMLDVEGYSLLTGKQRIIGYLLNQVAQEGQGGRDVCVDLSVAKSVIASRLNLTQEHFSRILHELSALELIRVEGRRLRIPDLERLARHQCELAASGR